MWTCGIVISYAYRHRRCPKRRSCRCPFNPCYFFCLLWCRGNAVSKGKVEDVNLLLFLQLCSFNFSDLLQEILQIGRFYIYLSHHMFRGLASCSRGGLRKTDKTFQQRKNLFAQKKCFFFFIWGSCKAIYCAYKRFECGSHTLSP